MTRIVGCCTSSRSERHLVQALVDEMNNGKYKLKAEPIEINSMFFTPLRNTSFDILCEYDFLIIPADRTEMTRFAYDLFVHNIPFCHFLAGSRSYSYTHDDVNRQMISLMANACFGESPEACRNLHEVGIPDNRIVLTGTSHFDGVTIQDIEANKPKDAPDEKYDLILLNPETQGKTPYGFKQTMPAFRVNKNQIHVKPNEDHSWELKKEHKEYSRLEFLYLLKHCDQFISNSSTMIYEVPYLNKYYGAKIKIRNPSQRNRERTPIDPMYCRDASKIVAEWCEAVDLEWLKTPKRLFQDTSKSFPSGY